MSHENLEQRAISQLATCAKDLRESKAFVVIDYEATEEKYGRVDAKPVFAIINEVRPGVSLDRANVEGALCAGCPVRALLGECSIRGQLQDLAADQRAAFELSRAGAGNLNEIAELYDPHLAASYQYEDGWRQIG